MIPRGYKYFTLLATMCVVTMMAGCIASSDSPRFYLLSGTLADQLDLVCASADRPAEVLRIGIGPIQLPDYLDRPQIVSRAADNELQVNEFHRWAGSLEKDFSTILANDVSVLLDTDAVLNFPWLETFPLDYRVEVVVTRFDGTLGDAVNLKARWMVFWVNKKNPLIVKTSSLSVDTADSSYSSYVAAQAQLVRQLAVQIACAIGELEKFE